ncbi:MAG: DUF4838 domain-containing protein [Clostridiales bacterium]|nr:DUF4838 domain-containing protein [Clostridiales bacterium]
MKKMINKICSALLCFTVLCSAVACGGSSGSNDDNTSSNSGNSTVTLKDPIYTDGVHVYDYTETDKYVVKNGQSDYKIVLSANPSSLEKLAADELVLFFEEATGVTLPIVSDGSITYSQDSKVICLGKNEYYRTAYSLNDNLSTDGKNLEHDGFMIETVGNGIFIFGDFAEGALFGVYRYLAIEFNYDCYSNTAYYLNTGVKDVSLKDFSVIDVPDYMFRQVRYSHIHSNHPTQYRMGFDYGESYAIGNNSAHTSFIYLPKDKYQTEHDKWYSLDNTQLCYYARGDAQEYEAMINKMFEIMKEYFKTDDGYFFRLGHADSVSWCNCKACLDGKEKYGADSASVIIFANKLAEKMDAWLATEEGKPYARDYKISVLAYGTSSTLRPPAVYDENKKEWKPTSPDVICHERVMPWFAPLEVDYNYTIFEDVNKEFLNYYYGWCALSDDMSCYFYSTNFKKFLIPAAFFDPIQGMYQLGAKAGGYYVLDDGQSSQANAVTGWHILRTYILSKISWNVNYDLNQLIENFFKGYFGVSADTMRSFYESYRVHAEYTVNHVYNAGISIYMPLLDVRYWPKNVLDQWNGYVETALSQIEVLKRVDQNAYQRYYDRITLERISLYYMMIELHKDSYSESFVQKMKLAFKEDCARLGVTDTGSASNDSIDELLKSWGM